MLVPLFCSCGGLVVGVIGSTRGQCMKCQVEYKLEKVE